MALQYIADANFQTVTLNAAIIAGDTSIVLTAGHGARLPSTGDFWMRCEDEVWKVTARATDTLTVTRGQDNTTAVGHAGGTTCRWVLSYSALDQLRKDEVSSGTRANLPASGVRKEGDLYFETDSGFVRRFDGSAWELWKDNYKCTVPVAADFTAVNADNATITDTNAGLVVSDTNESNTEVHFWATACPTPPYTITVKLGEVRLSSSANGPTWGIGFSDGTNAGTSKVKLLNLAVQDAVGGVGPSIQVQYWTSSTAFSGYLVQGKRTGWALPPYLQISDDNANRIYRFSYDGVNYTQVASEGRTADMTATHNLLFLRTSGTSTDWHIFPVHSWIAT